jgi:MYXO-CTERM domain-containing protein
MKTTHLALAALLAVSGAAQGAGIIQSGTTYLQFTGTPFSGTSGDANLFFGSSSAFATDMLYKYGWAYNQGAGTSNRTFSGLGGPVESYVGDTATFTWTNAGAGTAGFARWDAVMTIKLVQISPTPGSNLPGQAFVDTQLSFKSNASNTGNVTFTVFNLQDFDILGTNANAGPGDTYTVLNANGVRLKALDPTKTFFAESQGWGATRYEFNTGTNLRNKLGFDSDQTAALSSLTTLAGTTAANLVNQDGALAYQWTQTLAPGQSMNIHTAFSINAPVPEASTTATMALGLLGLAALRLRRRRD